MTVLVFLQTFVLLLIALGAATVVVPLASKSTTPRRPLLLGFASLAVPFAFLGLFVFGLRLLLD